MSTQLNEDEVVPDWLRKMQDEPEATSFDDSDGQKALVPDLAGTSTSGAPVSATPQSENPAVSMQISSMFNADEQPLPACTWEAPDLSFLEPRRLSSQVVPLQVLGSGNCDLVQSIAHALGAPTAYVLLALLVATATVFGCARRIRGSRGWTEPCLPGGVLVGPPGMLKSPTCDAFVKALFVIERREGKMHREYCRGLADARLVAAVRDQLHSREVYRAILAGAPPPQRAHVTAADLRDPPAPALVSTTGSPEGLRQRAAQAPTGLLL